MKAFILAAGVGSRLVRVAQNRPKCLLTIGGQTLMSRMLDLLQSRGIRDITVITGYRADLVRREVGDRARLVHNPFFHVTNSIASLWFAREHLEGDAVVTNGDLFFEPALLDELLADPRDRVMLCDSTRIVDADYRFTLDGDRIVAFGKDLPVEQTSAEYVGQARIAAAAMPAFRRRLEALIAAQKAGMWWEDVLYSFIPEGTPIFARDVAGVFWGEVDYVEDYDRIVRWVNARRAAGEAPHRLVEEQDEKVPLVVLAFPRGICVRVEPEDGFLAGLFRVLPVFGKGIEGDPAGNQGDQGFGAHADARGVDPHIESAGGPEAAVRADEPVVGVVDEDLGDDLRPVLAQLIGDDLAHADLPEVDGTADLDRFAALRLEDEMPPGQAGCDDGGLLETGEVPLRPPGRSGVEVDVGSGKHRPQAVDRARRDPGADHPEAGVLGDQPLGVAGEGRAHQDSFQVRAQLDRRDLADVDVLVADLGLAGLEPLGGLEGDRDFRTLFAERLVDQPGADQRRGEGDDPNQRKASPAPHLGAWCRGKVVGLGIRLIHRASSRNIDPRSGADRNSWRRTW